MKVIVTGASRGIGRGIATELGKHGYTLGLVARSGALLEEIANQINDSGGDAHSEVADLRSWDGTRDAIEALIDRMSGVDALINNAGQVIRKDAMAIGIDEWCRMIETNVNGVFYATRAVLPTLTSQERGHIINVSSISGYFPLPGGSGYAASKYAVTGFSESLFQEVRDYGIKVTTVFPGSVDTQSHRHDPNADHSWKVQPEEVGKACRDALETSSGNCISRIEIRPVSRPPKR